MAKRKRKSFKINHVGTAHTMQRKLAVALERSRWVTDERKAAVTLPLTPEGDAIICKFLASDGYSPPLTASLFSSYCDNLWTDS